MGRFLDWRSVMFRIWVIRLRERLPYIRVSGTPLHLPLFWLKTDHRERRNDITQAVATFTDPVRTVIGPMPDRPLAAKSHQDHGWDDVRDEQRSLPNGQLSFALVASRIIRMLSPPSGQSALPSTRKHWWLKAFWPLQVPVIPKQ